MDGRDAIRGEGVDMRQALRDREFAGRGRDDRKAHVDDMQRALPSEGRRRGLGDKRELRRQIGLGQRRTHPRIMVERRSEEHTSELQSLMRISYAVICLNKKKNQSCTI